MRLTLRPLAHRPGEVRRLPIGWGRLLRGNRTLAAMGIVALVALAAGIVLSRFVLSPQEAAARSAVPAAGPITAPVVSRQLTNLVTFRADATYAGSENIAIPGAGSDSIVTGRVPGVGTKLKAGGVAIEISGRPVIVLPGVFSSYRDLAIGDSGPDVQQLKRALGDIGIAPENGDGGDVYTTATAREVGALYRSVGYSPAAGPSVVRGAVAAAEATEGDARDNLVSAQAALAAAAAAPTASEVIALANAVSAAQRSLVSAQATGSADDIAAAKEALKLARAQQADGLKRHDVTAEQASVETARRALSTADIAVAQARQDALPIAPAAELLYLSQLPRRVDAVTVKDGSIVSGSLFTASGATLQLAGTVDAADKDLLTAGLTAQITLSDGTGVRATISSIAPHTAASDPAGTDSSDDGNASTADSVSAGLFDVILHPTSLTAVQLRALRGTNVKVEIAVGATRGRVLAVPLAAVTADGGGASRVEVVRRGGRTETVAVKTGLAAGGYVQVTAAHGTLSAGDRVVVGK
jgi:hypothetical protein